MKELNNFHKYLYGQELYLRTDHSALTWLMDFGYRSCQDPHVSSRIRPYFQMNQDKMIPVISFEGPIMQMLDISLAYDPAI
jgi:hypothetical protein